MADILWFGESEDYLKPVRAPAAMSVLNQDYDSGTTARTANGQLVRTVVRGGANNVRKLQLEWRFLSWNEGSDILSYVSPTYIYCKYPDPQTGSFRTMKCYVGDRTSEVRRIDGKAGPVWDRIAFNLTEV